MARPHNGSIDETLRRAASTVGAHARVTCGWLELTAAIPGSAHPALDDLVALDINSRLRGSSRVARVCGSPRSHLRADVAIERVADLAEWTRAACADFSDVMHHSAGTHDSQLSRTVDPRSSVADVERACSETGWHAIVTDGANLRVDIPTRHAVYSARLDSSPTAGQRLVVDLLDVANRPDVCRRAAAAFLLAVSASVRLVKGSVVWGPPSGGPELLVLMSGLCQVNGPAVDEALSALAVACQVAGREVQALMDERLASAYAALSCGVGEEEVGAAFRRPEDTRVLMEEDPCLLPQ